MLSNGFCDCVWGTIGIFTSSQSRRVFSWVSYSIKHKIMVKNNFPSLSSGTHKGLWRDHRAACVTKRGSFLVHLGDAFWCIPWSGWSLMLGKPCHFLCLLRQLWRTRTWAPSRIVADTSIGVQVGGIRLFGWDFVLRLEDIQLKTCSPQPGGRGAWSGMGRDSFKPSLWSPSS